MFIGMLLVHFYITIRIINTTLAFVQFPADNLNSDQLKFVNNQHNKGTHKDQHSKDDKMAACA